MTTIETRINDAVVSMEYAADVAEKFVDVNYVGSVSTKKGSIKSIKQIGDEAEVRISQIEDEFGVNALATQLRTAAIAAGLEVDADRISSEASSAIAQIAHYREEGFIAEKVYSESRIYFIDVGVAYTPLSFPYEAGLSIEADKVAGKLTVLQGLTNSVIGEGIDQLPTNRKIDLNIKYFDGLSSVTSQVTSEPLRYRNIKTVSRRTPDECAVLGLVYPDNGGGYYVIGEGFGAADGDYVIDAGSKQIKLQVGEGIRLEQFGATESENAVAINKASVIAESLGLSVHTSLKTISLDANVDFRNVSFVGYGTLLIPNSRDMRNIGVFVGVRQSDGRGEAVLNSPLDAHSAVGSGFEKIVYEDGGRVCVITRGGAGQAGILHEIVTGNVVAPSLPSSSLNGNWEFYRTTLCRGLLTAFVYNQVATETGAWEDYAIPDSFLDSSGAVSLIKLGCRKSIAIGNEIELTAQAGRDGKIRLGLFGTASSPVSQEIKIDGVVVKNVNLQSIGVWLLELETTPGTHTVSLTHDPSGTSLYVIGVNIYELKDLHKAPLDSVFTNVAPYQKGPSYIKSDGAHDYAIRSKVDNLWGGSYHGGETRRADPMWYLDGLPVDPTISNYVGVGKAFSLFQQTQINWSTESLNLNSMTTFSDSDINMIVATEGTVRAITFHAGMCGTSDSFKGLMSNRYIADVTAVSGSQSIGRVNSLTQINQDTGRKITLRATIQGFENSPDYGGATVTYASGLYNKVYFGPVRNSDQDVTDLTWGFTKTFS